MKKFKTERQSSGIFLIVFIICLKHLRLKYTLILEYFLMIFFNEKKMCANTLFIKKTNF